MKKISLYLLGVLTVFLVAWKTSDNVLKFGDASNGTNKELIFDIGLGTTNPKIVYNTTSGKLTFTNDGVNSKDIGSGSGGGTGTNLLENGGCENGTSTPDDWTASGGALSRTTVAANVGYENATCVWNASASSQTLTSSDTAVVNGLEGNTCVASGRYLYAGTTGDYIVRVEDDAGNALTADTALNYTNSLWSTFIISFPCPSDDSIRLEFASAVADPGDLLLDQMHLGSNNSEMQSSQATIAAAGSFANTTNCSWSRANTAVGAFGTDSDCPAITVDYSNSAFTVNTSDTDLPQIVLTNAPPGVYEVTAGATIDGSTGADSQLAIYDGTGYGGSLTAQSTGAPTRQAFALKGVFSYSSAGTRTFAIHGAVASGTLSLVNNAAGTGPLSFKITRYPLNAEIAVKSPDTQGALLRAYHANNCDWSNTTSTSYTSGTADASCTFTTEKTNGFSGILSENTGVANTNYPGITFTPPYAGNYMVCAQTLLLVGTSNAYGSLRLYDGTNTLAELAGRSAGTSGAAPYHICGVLEVSSVSSKTVKLQAKTDSGLHNISAGAGSSGSRASIEWTIFPMTQNFPSAVMLSSYDPTRISTAAAATKMGHYVYTCSDSGSANDVAYNNGVKCTIGNNGSGAAMSNVTRAWLTLKQTYDGRWLMSGKMVLQWATTDTNSKNISINGVTYKNTSNFYQPVMAFTSSTGSCGAICNHYATNAMAYFNDDNIVVQNGSGSFNWGNISFSDLELESKPTWAY